MAAGDGGARPLAEAAGADGAELYEAGAAAGTKLEMYLTRKVRGMGYCIAAIQHAGVPADCRNGVWQGAPGVAGAVLGAGLWGLAQGKP